MISFCFCLLNAPQPALAETMDLLEIPLQFKGKPFSVPPAYGRLIEVVESNRIQYLYFQDAEGTIRILLVGPRGTTIRASQGLELLSEEVYTFTQSDSSTGY